jgi:hypothetical protein
MSFFAPGPIVSAKGTPMEQQQQDTEKKERKGDESAKQQLDSDSNLETKVEDLYALIDDIKV